MTKRELAYKIIHSLEGGKFNISESRYDIRYVMGYISQAYTYLIKKAFFDSKRYSDRYDGLPEEFISVFEDVDVKKNESRGIYYSDVPGTVISIYEDRGIKSISWMKDDEHFIRVSSGAAGVWGALESNLLGGKIGYWLEGKKIVYKNMNNIDPSNTTVLVRMLSGIELFDDNDTIPMPSDYEYEITMMVKDLLREKKTVEEDIVNDNA